MSDRQPVLPNRQTPFSEAFRQFIAQGWAPHDLTLPAPLPSAGPARVRRDAVSALFPGERLIVPAGGLKVRSNDTDFRYRPHSAFAHLTGLGTDREPDAVLVLEPTDAGHEATLYFKPRAPRDSAEFYADARYGEMWVGKRPSLDEMAALCGVACAPVEELPDQIRKSADTTRVRVVSGMADGAVADALAEIRADLDEEAAEAVAAADLELLVALSELRLTKDAYEVEQMREACRQTADGFTAVVADLPEALRRGRG